uniref:Uncharacterized protein n=1 Tax=Oryzias melastigma TaxID=30732 RepID=A0A3B3DE14_ORYME
MPEEVIPASLGLSSQTANASSFHGCIRNLYINHELQDFTRSTMKPGVLPGCQPCRQLYCVHGICQPNAAQVSAACTGECCLAACTGNSCLCVHGTCVVLDAQTYRCQCEKGYAGALCNSAAGSCRSRPCLHGSCAQTEEGESCVCERGFTGESCDAESPCRGDPVRDFHRLQRGSALCQTTKPFSWVECQGACGAASHQGVNATSSCCAPLRIRRRRLAFECDDGTSFTQDVEKPVECGCKECV